jgi:hypothetical protein
MYSMTGPDKLGIEGKKALENELPPGYIYCPGCECITKLRGISNKSKTWFGKCSCGYRIIWRNEDQALAYVDNSGFLHSYGFEPRSFRTYIGNIVLYPYVF